MRALPTLGLLFFLLMVFGYVMSYDQAPIVGATIAFVILAIPSHARRAPTPDSSPSTARPSTPPGQSA